MSVQLVLATRNAKKLAELDRLLASAGLDVEILGSDAFSDLPEIEETGSTFAENSLIKARAVAAHTGLIAIADDSGLCVDALDGQPGIYSARWAGPGATDESNLDLVLEQIRDVEPAQRTAHFACAAALVLPSGEEYVVQGQVDGVLLTQRRGVGGFGYDPIFLPDGFDITTAEMTSDQKDAISHRGQAMRALVPLIQDHVN
ncbi:MAG: RdgB/HAM1 family non-canonical purine NTP pyrophosphatase [Actinobacteria bacterium]|uniref:dITP/XTP pyrophosphatase n=1 Tax=freshwater metagenome TaxID=449393 RepID=A0A6J6VVW9_9ZZZZ|nr:RdgB/HAM1 family non-canonical purine NTP pyrophosphatase [Actinomycetota bacterium]